MCPGSLFLLTARSQCRLAVKTVMRMSVLQMRAENEMKKVLMAAEAPTAMRLLLHDAATYDVATKSGGVNGSIVTSEELNRPVNKDLKTFVNKLAKVRESIKASGPESQKMLSWADTVVLAAKVTTEQSWKQAKASKSEKSLELAEKFGNPFDIKIGRLDSDSPDGDSSIPPAGSSPAEVQTFMSSLNVKNPSELGGPLSKKAPFWERPTFLLWTAAQENPAASEEQFGAEPEYADWKKKYDQSRSTTFRQDYEIDFVAFFNKLADLGAKFDKNAYLYDIIIQVPDRF